MLIVFELHVRPDFDEAQLLDAEAREELRARVLTRREALAAGLPLPAPGREGEVRYLPVNARHRAWVERAIDGCPSVAAFDVHDVGG